MRGGRGGNFGRGGGRGGQNNRFDGNWPPNSSGGPGPGPQNMNFGPPPHMNGPPGFPPPQMVRLLKMSCWSVILKKNLLVSRVVG